MQGVYWGSYLFPEGPWSRSAQGKDSTRFRLSGRASSPKDVGALGTLFERRRLGEGLLDCSRIPTEILRDTAPGDSRGTWASGGASTDPLRSLCSGPIILWRAGLAMLAMLAMPAPALSELAQMKLRNGQAQHAEFRIQARRRAQPQRPKARGRAGGCYNVRNN